MISVNNTSSKKETKYGKLNYIVVIHKYISAKVMKKTEQT